ncbi:MAG: chitosanase [Syntrophobacteraceae bacterium]|jgi:hypothetical protein
MAVKVDHFGKTGRVETNGKPAAAKQISKKTSSSNVFQILLNKLKAKDSNVMTGGLRNRPASSEVIKADPHRHASKNHGATHGLNTQNVNNLAASTLIAMSALSSGPNRIGNLCSQNVRRSSQPNRTSNAATGLAALPVDRTKPYRGQKIGTLSARFESGENGPGVIGYDYNGGTSYGTYQISSRAGTMKYFVEYLSERAPDIAAKLKAAGSANTGGVSGKMPEVWKKAATEDPVRFSKLQHDFIEKTHYLPAVQEISDRTGLDISGGSRALQEVLWSTAVQHGPKGAAKIFSKAVDRAQSKDGGVKTAQLINSVYAIRAGQFGSSGHEVVAAARSRFKEEGKLALEMLSDPFLNSEGVRA